MTRAFLISVLIPPVLISIVAFSLVALAQPVRADQNDHSAQVSEYSSSSSLSQSGLSPPRAAR